MSAATAEGVRWTRRDRDLWTGRRDDVPAGTIEHGRRYTYIGVDGDPHGGYRTLAAAQEAADHAAELGRDTRRAKRYPLLLTTGSAVLVIDAVLVGGALLLRF